MTAAPIAAEPNLLIVAQSGRLSFEAVIFAASLRRFSPGFTGRLIIAEPQPAGAWAGHDTLIPDAIRDLLAEFGAAILPFTAQHFGASYPYGNKIEALSVLPDDAPFVFFDTDTLITGELNDVVFDFARPAASMQRTGTWPEPPLYGPDYAQIWAGLYDRFNLDFDSSLDLTYTFDDWQRYLYFNAGWFFGPDPAQFRQRFLNWALAVRDDPGAALACQSLDPWLDQIVLPLVIHSLGGGRPTPALATLDGETTCHYRNLPLLYATGSETAIAAIEAAVAPNFVKKVLRDWMPAKKLIYQGKGRNRVRPLFQGAPLPRQQKTIRQRLRKEGWWLV